MSEIRFTRVDIHTPKGMKLWKEAGCWQRFVREEGGELTNWISDERFVVKVSIRQFDKVWDALPPELRICSAYIVGDKASAQARTEFTCATLGNLLLVVDFSADKDKVNEEVEAELKRVLLETTPSI